MQAGANTDLIARSMLRARNTLPYAMTLIAATALSFLSGGYILGRSTPVIVAWLCLAAVWVWFLRRRHRLPLLLLVALVAFGLFAVWTGLSVLWSVGPDLTWVAFNLTAFYLAVVAVLAVTSARGLQLQTAGYGYLVVATAVGVYAFLGKATPDLVTHARTYARLESPVGYWNVLAMMMAMGLCIVLALAADRRVRPVWRSLAVAAAVPMCFTFFFCFSRGGWLAAGVVLLLYFSFTTSRLASFATLVVILTPVALVLWRLRGLETLFAETTDDALRSLQAGVLLRWSLVAVLVAVAGQLVVSILQGSVRWPRWSALVTGAVILVLLGSLTVGGAARYAGERGGVSWVKDRLHALATDSDDNGSGNTAGRLTSANTGRPVLWREALDQSRYARGLGVGAGTFPLTHFRFRGMYGGVVKHSHSQWLNVLSELGVTGLVLYVVAMVLLVAAAVGNPFAWRRDPLHPLLVAMQAGVIAFFVHISWDWDWDMAAIGTVVFLFIGAAAAYRATRAGDARRAAVANASSEPEPEPAADVESETAGDDQGETEPVAATWRSRRFRRATPLVASLLLILLAVSWLPPYLAGRAENAALAAASDGDLSTGLSEARRAARWDPLAVSPLLTEALVLQQQGRNREALAVLRQATELQPDNFEVWYQLGVLQFEVLGRKREARASLKRALGLNPTDGASREELGRIVP